MAEAPIVEALVPETALIDLGKIPTEKPIPFKLVLVNHAKVPQTLLVVNPTCGCTTVSLPTERTVKPGEKIAVDMAFDPHGYFGKVSRSIEIHTDSTVKPNHTVWVASDVDAFCIPQPKVLLLAPNAGESATQEFRFVPLQKGLEPSAVTPQGEPEEIKYLKVEWASAIGGEVIGKVTFTPPASMKKMLPMQAKVFYLDKSGRHEYIKLVLEAR